MRFGLISVLHRVLHRQWSAAVLSAALVMVAPATMAQDQSQTLADIRQELTVLHVEIQRLKRELSTTGAPAAALSGDSVLERVTAIETELQRLTSQTEELDFRVQSVVRDGTNRIGDLEFRLVELEGGDISQLGETTTLGGAADNPDEASADLANAAEADLEPGASTELAVGESADFAAALTDLEAGAYQAAADKLAAFQMAYPGSPLAPEADFGRGKALDGLGDTREAARAYLAAFTAAPTGPKAAESLFELGAALGRLQQVDQACITLSEVAVRFPGDPAVAGAEAERTELGCP